MQDTSAEGGHGKLRAWHQEQAEPGFKQSVPEYSTVHYPPAVEVRVF